MTFSQNNDKRKVLLDSIKFNADKISTEEGRSREDAEYLAICTLLEELILRENAQLGWDFVMNILQNEYSEHHSDVLIFLTWKSGKHHFKEEAEKKLIERHDLKDFSINKEEAISLLITSISRNAIFQLSSFLKHKKDPLGEEFQTINEKEGTLNLIIAIITYELQVIKNLECSQNSKILDAEVKKQLFEKFGETALRLLNDYETSFHVGLRAAINVFNNDDKNQTIAQMTETDLGIPGCFLRNILGSKIKSFTFYTDSEEHINLYLATETASFLTYQLGTWKKIRSEHSRIKCS